jgi:CheY-like chemotaxis protein
MALRVFVAEDEILIALVLQDILEELGHSVVGPAARVEDACRIARDGAFDLAILDVKLADSEVYPVAEILEARGIPFAFATGYGRDSLAATFRSHPILPKPYTEPDVAALIRQMCGAD